MIILESVQGLPEGAVMIKRREEHVGTKIIETILDIRMNLSLIPLHRRPYIIAEYAYWRGNLKDTRSLVTRYLPRYYKKETEVQP
jgi:hypothetical protein